jgi:hypothetical protein
VVGALLGVWLEPKEPQAPALPHVTDQFIGEFAGSLRIAAATPTDALMAREVGGEATNKIEIGGEGGVIGGRSREPPHPINAPINPMHMNRTIAGRRVITCLHSLGPGCRLESQRSRAT